MKINVRTKLGQSDYTFQIDEAKEMDALHKAAVLGNVPTYCPICKNTLHFKLDSNKDKEGNIYVNVICTCGAKAKLGQYKTGGYFWHKFEVYQKANQSEQQRDEEPPPPSEPQDDLPF